MIPRRLLPYLALFLVLLGAYFGLTWYQAREETRKTEAKKIFQVKEGEIHALVLKRGKQEVRLAKKDGAWFLTKPLKMRADQVTVGAILSTLAHLQKERDLGKSQDLKTYGLDKPTMEVEFTVKDKKRRLVIGSATPGKMGYYAYQGQAPQELLVINSGEKSSLDRPEKDLRDKTLFAFAPDKVKSLTIKIKGAKDVKLAQVGPKSWRWVGREQTPVRGDRVEALVRFLDLARAKSFVNDAPKSLKPYGLAPPRGEVTVVVDKKPQRLLLGAKMGQGEYARKAPAGPVVVTDKDLLAQLTSTLGKLEDRRLWRGQNTAVKKVIWGPPGKTWQGIKEKDAWQITGPGQKAFKEPAVRLEVGLWKLQTLELSHPASPPKKAQGKPLYVLELGDGRGKSLFRLEELGQGKNKEVLVRVKAGDKPETGLIDPKAYQAWQKEMERLTRPPKTPKAAPEPKSKTEK
ncbi:MAG: DUF4340 domain-containing protein [Syntrophales bacterium]|nr:DUF4340 domain-containing protein [Syntrophales bacterium]